MLLRNYDNYITLTALNRNTSGATSFASTDNFGDGFLSIKATNGTICEPTTYYTMPIFYTWALGGNGCGTLFTFGSGNNPEHYDDYTVDSFVRDTDYTIINNTLKHTDPVYNVDKNTWENTISQTYCALKDLTIREIGILQRFQISGSTSSNNRKDALVYRKVLDTPIEVPANANFILSFTSKVSAHMNRPADYEVSASVTE